MARYCVEYDASASFFIVHKQNCSLYYHTYLLILDRISDIGEFAAAGDALARASRDFPDVTACDHCCQPPLAQFRPAGRRTRMLLSRST